MEMTIDESIKRLQALLKCVLLSDEQRKAISNGIEALEKQTPKEITMFDDGVYYCPACDVALCTEFGKGTGLCADKFCWQCGQAIRWDDPDA